MPITTISSYPVPVLRGDYPDPSIVRVGQDYYMTHSSFMYAPGLLVWHSRNLTDWVPLCHAIQTYMGDIWAPDLVYADGRFYIYFPANDTNYVVYADKAEGPWSEPIDLHVGGIDPGHLLGADGQRYLFLNFGRVVLLAPDGLSVTNDISEIYEGWPIPEEWATEGHALESPKLLARGGFYYMVSAQGGTAGPATSHMAVVARSENPLGPWENSPYNPLVHTWSKDERWWSKGHGTLVDTPNGKWYIVYHAYEKDFCTLGRQTLLEPIVWTEDGWPSLAMNADGQLKTTGDTSLDLSDDFRGATLGWQWRFYKELDPERYYVGGGVLKLRAKGESPSDSAPLLCIPLDHAYESEVQIKVGPEVEAGLLLFYNERCYAGIGFTEHGIFRLRRGSKSAPGRGQGSRLYLKIRNECNTVIMFYSTDGVEWTRFPAALEVSGYHHNNFGDFISLRLGIYAAGNGEAEISGFRYQAIKE
ncbi:family 43 glycosylhydrolase [Paenibacillus harenae]|uniref:family 43 glycosylhydrolase n=1 Tax=Paenibacillus harenae TaxID=306543 RepID=UPI0004203514|nr:family 43 glycosylhydrolase [Paenibacillus harenae]